MGDFDLASVGVGVAAGLLLGLGLGALLFRRSAPAVAVKGEAPDKPSAEPLRLLGLLQRDARLVDFLMEDIQAYPDAQVGVAVKDIHRKCGEVLREHVTIEPVLPQKEEERVSIPAGFDPSAVRLTGNVAGKPPFQGVVKHHGWRARNLKLPAPPAGLDEFVLMPAEVEL